MLVGTNLKYSYLRIVLAVVAAVTPVIVQLG